MNAHTNAGFCGERFLLLGMLMCLGNAGCILHARFAHDPPLARNVARIECGRTTRAEVLECFGRPDFEVHGSCVTHNPDGPMGRYYERLRLSNVRMRRIAGGTPRLWSTDEDRAFGERWLTRFLGLRAYSSIDDDHVAYLYEELEGWAGWGFTVPTVAGGSHMQIRQNRLLVLIDVHTDVVDMYGYRHEFGPR